MIFTTTHTNQHILPLFNHNNEINQNFNKFIKQNMHNYIYTKFYPQIKS